MPNDNVWNNHDYVNMFNTDHTLVVRLLLIIVDKNEKKITTSLSWKKVWGSYSFYKTASISSKLKDVDFRDHLPDGIQKYDESKARYGSPSYTVVIKNDAYRFYRLSSESDVLVTKSNKSDDSQIKEYARINKNNYKKLASSTHYTDYDQLDYWN